jgi:hypothetical protein
MTASMNGTAARAPVEAEASPMRVMPVLNPNHAHTVLAEVLERVNSRDGRRYLTGHVGSTKILIVPTGVISRGEPVWQTIVGEVALAQLFERADQAGRPYLIGRVGSAKLLVVLTEAVVGREPVWRAILEEGFYAERNGTAMARGLED